MAWLNLAVVSGGGWLVVSFLVNAGNFFLAILAVSIAVNAVINAQATVTSDGESMPAQSASGPAKGQAR